MHTCFCFSTTQSYVHAGTKMHPSSFSTLQAHAVYIQLYTKLACRCHQNGNTNFSILTPLMQLNHFSFSSEEVHSQQALLPAPMEIVIFWLWCYVLQKPCERWDGLDVFHYRQFHSHHRQLLQLHVGLFFFIHCSNPSECSKVGVFCD